jgi:orotate phosphoribosyltransferase
MSEQLRISTLQAGVWVLGKFVFASGKVANNKLDMPRALQRTASREPLIGRMAELALAHEPDAIWGVPTGGQEYAVELAYTDALTDVPLVNLAVSRDGAGKKVFSFATSHDRIVAGRSSRMVGVEDVTNEFTSTKAVLAALPELEGTVGIVAGARRGTPETEQPLSRRLSVDWAFEMPVPNVITPDHPLFQQYGQFAVGDFVEL